MSAEHDLHNAYGEWRRLAETEGNAIRAQNWPLLDRCHDALIALQSHITRQTQLAHEEWTRLGISRADREIPLRQIVNSLIELERRNMALLNESRRANQEESDRVNAAGQTLQRVRRSYAPAQPAAWSTFS